MFDLKSNILFAIKTVAKDNKVDEDLVLLKTVRYDSKADDLMFNVFIDAEAQQNDNGSYEFTLTDLLGLLRGNTMKALMDMTGFTVKKAFEVICDNYEMVRENTAFIFRKKDATQGFFLGNFGDKQYKKFKFDEIKM